MNAQIILVLLLYWSPPSSSLQEETAWINYKLTHHKTYADSIEEARRFQIFLDNLKIIQSNNELFERGHVPYKLGVNKFADVSQEEFSANIKANARNWNLKLRDRSFDKVEVVEDDGGVPDAMDWREKGAVTDVKDETYCYNGYSWAFSVIGAVETQHFLSNNTLENLSVQQLIDCTDPSDNFGEWYQNFAFDYLKKHTLATEEEYPNTCTEDTCRELGEVFVTEAVDMDSEYSIRIDCALTGPVTVYIDASRLQSYQGGIVDKSLCGNGKGDLNQSVLVVGYGEDDGKKFWVLKNSWGVDWGEKGYLRTERWANNTCGIAWSAVCPYII